MLKEGTVKNNMFALLDYSTNFTSQVLDYQCGPGLSVKNSSSGRIYQGVSLPRGYCSSNGK